VDSAEEKATRIAAELGFAEDEVMQISMAVREGAVNAVLHGNAYAAEKKVTLAFERTAEDLVIICGVFIHPDADDNALEPTRRGQSFPTGQPFPPAHPGCRCLLAVVDERRGSE